MLWFLRPAEAIARDYVAILTYTVEPTPSANRPAGHSAADATRLAQAFRTLAAALATFLDAIVASQPADMSHARCASLSQCAACLLATLAGQAVERRDSS